MGKRRYYFEGKKVSKGEKKIAEFLRDNNIQFNREYSFKDLLSIKGRRLRFDFFLPLFKLLIEFDGIQHYKPANRYRKAKIVHNNTVIHDQLKRDYVSRKDDLKLFRIPYWSYNDIETILKKELEKIDTNNTGKTQTII